MCSISYRDIYPSIINLNGNVMDVLALSRTWAEHRIKGRGIVGGMPSGHDALKGALVKCYDHHKDHFIDIATRYLDLSESLTN